MLFIVGELCGCTKDRQEAHGFEMGRFQGIVDITIPSIGYEEEQLMKWKCIQKKQGKEVQEYTSEFQKQAIRMGICLEE